MNKTKYVDEFNNSHYVGDELGRGGQGVVYRTKDADTVIKKALNNEQPITDKIQIKTFHQKIKNLIYKPLPKDIKIAKPLAILKEEAGYVMYLLEGMNPFAQLLPQELKKEEASKIEIPEFLKELEERSAIYFTYYLKTGGLRKRLYSLSRLAITLYRLHSRGIVYFDISHNNIFINDDDIPLVYLIDADNIEYESDNKEVVYTPNFEVPEIVKGEANTTYSDIYAFGILSFLTLTTLHPFEGKGLEKNEWDEEESEKKEKWELPWIEDSNDDSNKSKKSGLRGSLTLTKEIDSLFHTLFEKGKENKFQRPTLPLWIESLEKAASKTLLCPSCKMSYYDDIFKECPYCKTAKPRRLIVESYYYKNGQKKQKRWQYIKEINDDTKKIEISSSIFKTFNILNIDDVFLEIKFPKKTRVELWFNKGDENVYFESTRPIATSKKRIGIQRLEKGISIITEGDISTLVEVKIEL